MPVTVLGTQDMPLADLERFPGNARRGKVAEIVKSLKRHGQYRAIVVRAHDGRHTILAGNHTYDALAELAASPPTLGQLLDLVPEHQRAEQEPTALALLDQLARQVARAEIIQCTGDEARRINLADNRLSDLAGDDPEAMAALLADLDGDYFGTGWTEDDLKAFQHLAEPPDLDDLADDLGEPEDDDLWPILRFKVPPNIRDDFYELTAGCELPEDDNARFIYLINRVRAQA